MVQCLSSMCKALSSSHSTFRVKGNVIMAHEVQGTSSAMCVIETSHRDVKALSFPAHILAGVSRPESSIPHSPQPLHHLFCYLQNFPYPVLCPCQQGSQAKASPVCSGLWTQSHLFLYVPGTHCCITNHTRVYVASNNGHHLFCSGI